MAATFNFIGNKCLIMSLACLVLLVFRSHAISVPLHCQQTSYPDVCAASLASLPSASPKNVVKNSLSSALNGVLSTLQLVQSSSKLPHSVNTSAALRDCLETLDLAVDQANVAFSQFFNSDLSNASVEFFNELLTQLSAALTNQYTCLDGLGKVNSLVANQLASPCNHNNFLLSNGLALTKWWKSLVHGPKGRRLMSADADDSDELHNVDADGFPSWLPQSHRRLLQSSKLTANVVVAKDGSGKYKTIQEAVNNAPQNSKTLYVIYIKAGVYYEQVNVQKKLTNLVFVGDGIGKTIITGSRNVQQSGVTTFNSATVIISAGNFLGAYLTIRNTAGPSAHQAVALRVSADKVTFYKSSLEAYQDTLYTHSLRQFYRECTIQGSVDFIFGNSAVVLQSCTIMARVGTTGQYVTFTAQARTDKNQNTGISFHNSYITGTSDLKASASQHTCYLGRPWQQYSRVVYMKCYLDSIINPAGWISWNGDPKNPFYAEYANYGPGSSRNKRVSWSTAITQSQANAFTVGSFIQGSSWIPSQVPYQSGL